MQNMTRTAKQFKMTESPLKGHTRFLIILVIQAWTLQRVPVQLEATFA